jgi:hypothetical protein
VIRLSPQRPPPDATYADRLRYVRRLAIQGLVIGVPVWIFVFVYTQATWAIVFCVAVNASGLINVATLSWRIRREEGG